MIRKHRIYFFFWKIKMYFKGIKPGATVYSYSQHKSKYIKGTIICLDGDSITQKDYGFNIEVKFEEPHQGNDNDYFISGSYELKDFKKQLILSS